MRKGVAAEILMDSRILLVIQFLKWKFNGTFTHIIQIVHSNAHLKPLKDVFSDKPLIIADFQLAEMLDSQET